MKKKKMDYDSVIAWARKRCKEYTEKEVKESSNVLIRLSSSKRIDSNIVTTY